jgi:hypothetical protein
MLLELVWRNPDPPAKVASKVRRIQGDQDGAVYEVSNDIFREKLEVIRSRTASQSSLKPGCKCTHHS